jgi:hypothetical protein
MDKLILPGKYFQKVSYTGKTGFTVFNGRYDKERTTRVKPPTLEMLTTVEQTKEVRQKANDAT